MINIKADVKYFPYPMPHRWAQTAFRHNERKLNLLWLVNPKIDTFAHLPWEGDEISASIDQLLDKQTMRSLNKPPIEFMQDFCIIDTGDLLLTETWPHNYLQTMWARAREANKRLIAGLGPNVLRVDFLNKRRFGQ